MLRFGSFAGGIVLHMTELIFSSDTGDWPPKGVEAFTVWLLSHVPESERGKATIEFVALSGYDPVHIARIKISY